MLISKYGFSDVLQSGHVVLDPSRVAAQIVSGIGFLGAGLIFVRRDSVRGLTTAAAVWVTAAVGAAAGAGLPLLAALTAVMYFIVALAFPVITRRLPRSSYAISTLRIRYPSGRGLLRQLLQITTERGFVIDEVSTHVVGAAGGGGPRGAASSDEPAAGRAPGMAEVALQVHGKGSINELAAALSEVEEVDAVVGDDVNAFVD
jgi:putative Mg2+ transporter-C (MgtC) family protein